MRLLLVEDDAMIGEALRTGLRRDGFAVDWVRDGDSADQVLRTEAFDLLLLDNILAFPFHALQSAALLVFLDGCSDRLLQMFLRLEFLVH